MSPRNRLIIQGLNSLLFKLRASVFRTICGSAWLFISKTIYIRRTCMHTSIIYVTKKVIHWGANHPSRQHSISETRNFVMEKVCSPPPLSLTITFLSFLKNASSFLTVHNFHKWTKRTFFLCKDFQDTQGGTLCMFI